MKKNMAKKVEPGRVEMASGQIMNTSPGPAFKHTAKINAVVQAGLPRNNNTKKKAFYCYIAIRNPTIINHKQNITQINFKNIIVNIPVSKLKTNVNKFIYQSSIDLDTIVVQHCFMIQRHNNIESRIQHAIKLKLILIVKQMS